MLRAVWRVCGVAEWRARDGRTYGALTSDCSNSSRDRLLAHDQAHQARPRAETFQDVEPHNPSCARKYYSAMGLASRALRNERLPMASTRRSAVYSTGCIALLDLLLKRFPAFPQPQMWRCTRPDQFRSMRRLGDPVPPTYIRSHPAFLSTIRSYQRISSLPFSHQKYHLR
ncbi:hypothetical protein BKA93DRAFT_119595 [Sparassis latifolia]